ncbi:MAG: protein-methionine-sulfoxide reductase catalytic subunit MsrP [Gammaproteobacteria bacterium]|nr:protein-methionine-sulfoxide reductase catalytic subunit MsrP [Gammaproteobacteria bacterium]
MQIRIKRPWECKESEVTEPTLYCNRRQFIKTGSLALLGSSLLASGMSMAEQNIITTKTAPLPGIKKTTYKLDDKLTTYSDATTYNNFYEFGTDKKSPALNATAFKTAPWRVSISGECAKTGRYNLEDILKPHSLEERIYRFRCVEAWSMVVPWVGFSLADLLKRFEPNSKAKYVEFITLHDPEQMPGQRRKVLDWPYTEGLRIDEAMHPLSMLVVGMYGNELPNQNGAPLRLIIPWKYGFKSIKSIVGIRFSETMPTSSWMKAGPSEYGFYANVNPEVDHPRWTQKRERRLGGFFKQDTLKFNGYAEEVASLYTGMNLKKFF